MDQVQREKRRANSSAYVHKDLDTPKSHADNQTIVNYEKKKASTYLTAIFFKKITNNSLFNYDSTRLGEQTISSMFLLEENIHLKKLTATVHKCGFQFA